MKNDSTNSNGSTGFESDSSAHRIMTNGLFTAVRFAVYTLSVIIFIPYLVKHFGKGAYGLIGSVGFLTQYIGLVQRCIGNAVARFLNIALNQQDWKKANEIFSTAMLANVGFIVILAPIFGLAVWKLDVLFDFSPEQAQDFRIMVICMIAMFFITVLTGVMSTPIQAANRLDITSVLDIVRLISRLVMLFVLIETMGPFLWIIGATDLLLSILNLLIIVWQGRKLAPLLRFDVRRITAHWIRPVMNMAGWSMVTALGGLTFIKTDIWLINRFVDREVAGVYAALLVWPNFLRQVSKQLATVLTPVYLIDYARGNVERVARMSLSSAKLLSCFVACCVGGIWVLAEPFLELWLDESFVQYAYLLRLMVVYLAFTIGEAVLWQIYTTVNKVHVTGIISIISGVLNIGLSLLFIHLGFGAAGVAVGTALAQVYSAVFAIPIGVCREFGMPLRTVWWNHLSAGLFLLMSYGITELSWYIFRQTPLGGILVFVPLMAAGLFFLMRVVLSADERALMHRLLNGFLRRISLAAGRKS